MRALVRPVTIAAVVAVMVGAGVMLLKDNRSPDDDVSPVDRVTVAEKASLEPSPSSTANDPAHLQPCEAGPNRNGFDPPTYREGDLVVLPIVFSDGTTAELLYPASLSVHEGNIVQSISIEMKGCSGNCYRGVNVRETGWPRGRESLLGCYDGRQKVELWHSDWVDVPEYIVWRVGPWTAELGDGNVGDYLSPDERLTLARDVTLERDQSGWPLINGGGNLSVGVESGKGGDVSMWLEFERGGILSLWPTSCRPDPADDERPVGLGAGDWFASRCLADGNLKMHVQGPERFVRSVHRDLEARDVRRAYPAGRYQIVP